MSALDWLVIIAKILLLIAEGMGKSQAVEAADSLFNIS